MIPVILIHVPLALIHVPLAVTHTVKRRQVRYVSLMRDVLLTLINPGRGNAVAVGTEQ